jgi:hypothetical protein
VSPIHIQGFKLANTTACGLDAAPGDKLHTSEQPLVATCLSCLSVFKDRVHASYRAPIKERIRMLRAQAEANT